MSSFAKVRRRAARARLFPYNTCPASRHVHMIADALGKGERYHMIEEEPEHVAHSLYAVIAALWEARAKLAKLEGEPWAGKTKKQLTAEAVARIEERDAEEAAAA